MKKEIFSLVPDYLPLGVIVYDNDGRLKYANAMALEVFGAKMEDVYDINLFDDPNITAEDKDRLRRKENVSFETDYNFDLCRNTFYKTSIVNTHKYFVTKITIMRDAMQTPLGYLLNCEDVTAKKAQERELVNSYKKIQSTQRELALALNAGNLTSWNYQVGAQKLYKVGGSVDSGEVKSFESIRERVHPDDKEAFVALLDTALQKQTSADNNNIVVRIFDPKNKN
ncbi:MAG: PAS domain-containing protein, partial [Alistipes sp.]